MYRCTKLVTGILTISSGASKVNLTRMRELQKKVAIPGGEEIIWGPIKISTKCTISPASSQTSTELRWVKAMKKISPPSKMASP